MARRGLVLRRYENGPNDGAVLMFSNKTLDRDPRNGTMPKAMIGVAFNEAHANKNRKEY
jgi:hypothetical protein